VIHKSLPYSGIDLFTVENPSSEDSPCLIAKEIRKANEMGEEIRS
jgi:hypothetical protein